MRPDCQIIRRQILNHVSLRDAPCLTMTPLIERLSLGESPCDVSTRQLTTFGLFADANQPHVVYLRRVRQVSLSARALSGETKEF